MADVIYDHGGRISLDGRYVERRDYGVQMKTNVVAGVTVYLGEVWREKLAVYLSEGKAVEAWCEVPYIEHESSVKTGERMGLERRKVLDKMGEEIALVLGKKEG